MNAYVRTYRSSSPQVEKFLVKAKEQVVLAKNQLKIIIDVLGLKTEAA